MLSFASPRASQRHRRFSAISTGVGWSLLGVVLHAAVCTGQTTSPSNTDGASRFQLDLRGLIGVPQAEFADHVSTTGGFAGGFGYRIGDSPLVVGGTVGVLFHGRGSRREPLSLTIPDILVDVTTRTRNLQVHGRARIQARTGRVRPYVEGLIGLNYLFTTTSADLSDFRNFDDISTTNLSDVAPSVGGGGGVLVRLGDWSDQRLSLDIGAQYLAGGRAEFLVGGRRGFDEGVTGLELRESHTDMLLVVAGVALTF